MRLPLEGLECIPAVDPAVDPAVETPVVYTEAA